MYNIKTLKGEKKSAKGVDRAVKKNLSFDIYKKVLFRGGENEEDALEAEEAQLHCENMRRFDSDRHEVKTIALKKIALGDFNDKMLYFGPNDYLPHGHKDAKGRIATLL